MQALLALAQTVPQEVLALPAGSATRSPAFKHGKGFKQGQVVVSDEAAQRLAEGWEAVILSNAPGHVVNRLLTEGGHKPAATAVLSSWTATLSWEQFQEWSREARIDVLVAALGSPGPKAPAEETGGDAEEDEKANALEAKRREARGQLPGDCFPETPAEDPNPQAPPCWPQLKTVAATAVQSCLAALKDLPAARGRGPVKPSKEDLEAIAQRWVEVAQRVFPPRVTVAACIRHTDRVLSALTLMRNQLPPRDELTAEQQVNLWVDAVRNSGWPTHGSAMVEALVATGRNGALHESQKSLRAWLDAVQGLMAELCGTTYREYYNYCLRRAQQ